MQELAAAYNPSPDNMAPAPLQEQGDPGPPQEEPGAPAQPPRRRLPPDARAVVAAALPSLCSQAHHGLLDRLHRLDPGEVAEMELDAILGSGSFGEVFRGAPPPCAQPVC
jgi:hypothetical protein